MKSGNIKVKIRLKVEEGAFILIFFKLMVARYKKSDMEV